MLHAGFSPPAGAQPAPPPVSAAATTAQAGSAFTIQQIDALLAPIALYPDTLLTQMLIATTFPLQVVAAARWLKEPGRADLKGDALTKALEPLDWDPSVKSLIPFPQALSQLDNNLEWTQQVGYAFVNQQKETMDSIQRLRRQAQAEGNLKSTPQQVVLTEEAGGGAAAVPGAAAGAGAPTVATGTPVVTGAPSTSTIVIQPADPNLVYVPSYNPTTVYGAWPYPAYPPVAAYPAPVYMPGTALMSGLAFGAGIAVTAGLWGWAGSNWNNGSVNINANRWNNINVNRARTAANTWSPPLNRAGGRTPASLSRPPAGPVGRPGRNNGLPPNAIGRQSVGVAPGLVDRPRPPSGAGNLPNRPNLSPGSRPGGAQVQRPGGGQGQRPGAGQGQRPGGGQVQRPGGGQIQRPGAGQGQRPGGGQVQRPGAAPGQLPARQPGQGGRPGPSAGNLPRQQPGGFGGQRANPGAFGGVGEGNRAAAYGQRGMQSRQSGGAQQFGGRGGGFQGAGASRGGSGGFRGGGGGGRGGGGGGGRGGGRR